MIDIIKKSKAIFILSLIITSEFLACQSQENKYSIILDSSKLKTKRIDQKDSKISTNQDSSYNQKIKIDKKINSKVDKIYNDTRINIINVVPLMDKDFNKIYSIKIHNGSSKKIVGIILNYNFNKVLGDAKNGFNK